MLYCLERLTRRKQFDATSLTSSALARRLGAIDLTFLGVGCTLGAGVYVLVGQVAQATAGPSIVISFLIAGLASVMAGLCYAEFGARVPRAGSAYVYSYVTVGELLAFIIGWNLVLEYVIGSASVARAFSGYFDSLFDGKITATLENAMPIHIDEISAYPDFLAFGVVMILTLILCVGVKESSTLNAIFTVLNLTVVIYVISCGLFKVNTHNWALDKNELPLPTNQTNFGVGGFFPYGISGTFAGAATCFYAFVGFDAIATAGEETRNPQRNIPIGIMLSLGICFVAYCGVSVVLTLMVPYYSLDKTAALSSAFESIGWTVAKYFVAVGSICGLSSSLLGGMFPMPRIIYAMASDGLIFRFLSNVNQRFQTPIIATLVCGTLAGLLAMLLNLQELIEMMSIGTLLAYTLVAICVILLRYDCQAYETLNANGTKVPDSPNHFTIVVVKVSVFCVVLSLCALSALLIFAFETHPTPLWWMWLSLGLCLAVVIACLIAIYRQPQSSSPLAFKVPFTPLLPVVSIFANIYLILKLSPLTWLRFGIWMAIGFAIYFLYGIRHSTEEHRRRRETIVGSGDDAESLLGESAQNETLNKPDIANQLLINKNDSCTSE